MLEESAATATMSCLGDGIAQVPINVEALPTALAPPQLSSMSAAGPGSDSFATRHIAHPSVSTSASESSNSSPTTTVSTVDSSVADSSPSSSPESPTSGLSLTVTAPSRPLPARLAPQALLQPAPQQQQQQQPPPPGMTPPLSPFFGQGAPLSPGRKPRNTKNLSLNMAAPTRQFPPPALRIKTASAATELQSAPPSPSSTVPTNTLPIRPPKKRPSQLGLSVRTPAIMQLEAANGHAGSNEQNFMPPPTPSVARPNTLRHHQSSPALSLFSPTTGVPGGMQLPPFQPQAVVPAGAFSLYASPPQSRPSSFDSAACLSGRTSPVVPPRLEELEEEREDDYSVPLSQEVKSPAYPAGPVCIYDPHVYLYLEPSNEEASQFDVILNVAREVQNPFRSLSGKEDDSIPNSSQRSSPEGNTDNTATLTGSAPVTSPVSETAAATATGSPSPVCDSNSSSLEPEYIHIPWEHNSNIVDDMLRLVEVIDDRVRRGKRVLVHCQCGVSRSASLIVAYGLYRDPSRTVQEVYDAVKRKSRWIGPNMGLIYQLSEFRTKMIQRRGLGTSAARSWRGAGGKAGSTASGRANTLPSSCSVDAPLFAVGPFESRRSAPQTAPLPDGRDRSPGRSSPRASDSLLPPVNTDKSVPVAPGPSSAPSDVTWDTVGRPALGEPWMERRSASGTRAARPSPPPPLVLHQPPPPPPPPLPVQRPDPPVASTVASKGRDVDDGDSYAVEPVPPTPSLFSPRSSTFTANPFHEPLTKSFLGLRTSVSIDPRSPPQRGEMPIVRSIFDFL